MLTFQCKLKRSYSTTAITFITMCAVTFQKLSTVGMLARQLNKSITLVSPICQFYFAHWRRLFRNKKITSLI